MTEVFGWVRDDAGAPVAGARVMLTVRELPTGAVVFRDDVQTDGGGLYAFARVPLLGGSVDAPDRDRIAVEHPCFESVSVPLPVRSGFEIRLRLSAVINGRLIGERSRRPIGGARVRWRESGGLGRAGDQVTTTDAAGAFVLRAPPPGLAVLLVVERDGHFPRSVPIEVPMGSGPVTELEVLVAEPQPLHVRVVDAATGVGLADASLTNGVVEITRTAADGSATLFCEERLLALRATRAGYLITRFDLPELPATGASDPVELPLRPAATVRGRLIASGTALPLPGWSIRAFAPGRPPPSDLPAPRHAGGPVGSARAEKRTLETVTDEHGEFRLDSIPVEAEVHVNAHEPGVRATRALGRATPPSPGAVVDLGTIVIDPRWGEIIGGVVRGSPVAGAVVRVRSSGVIRSATTDEHGNYYVRNVPPGVCELSADHGGDRTHRTVELLPGQRAEIVLFLPKDAEERLSEGVVVDTLGRAVAGVPVIATSPSGRAQRALTGQDGRFRITTAPADLTCRIRVEAPYAPPAMDVAPGSRDVRIVLPVVTSRYLAVRSEQGVPFVGVVRVETRARDGDFACDPSQELLRCGPEGFVEIKVPEDVVEVRVKRSSAKLGTTRPIEELSMSREHPTQVTVP